MNIPIKEILYKDWSQEFACDEILFTDKIGEQELKIFVNKHWGKVLLIDNVVQTTELDEHIYHEMMAHVPLFAHPKAKNIAVIGGGDGGIIRELTKHDNIESIDMCELDGNILSICEKYLPNHSAGSFRDSRLNVNIEDGCEWIKKQDKDRFDVIISDCTDPIGPGENLFTSEFYKNVSRSLKDEGIFVAQNGVSFMQYEEILTSYIRLSKYFDEVGFFFANIPTYIGGQLAFAYGVKGNVDIKTHKEIPRWVNELKYYNSQIHQASFAVPNKILQQLDQIRVDK
jgi:spermidine synthase